MSTEYKFDYPTAIKVTAYADQNGVQHLDEKDAIIENIKNDLEQNLRIQLVRAFPDHHDERKFMARALTTRMASKRNELRLILESLIEWQEKE